jgi:uncharacterized protein YdaU (DUF1376 family)
LPLFTSDFIADTTHLDARETGAYVMLLMVAWQSPECRLPNNDRKLAAWARVDAETWREIKPEVMAFWRLAGGHWTQSRLLKEWRRALQLRDKQRANAMRRWHPHGDATAMPPHMPRHSQGNAPIPGEEPNIEKDARRSLDTLASARVADAPADSLDDIWPDDGGDA